MIKLFRYSNWLEGFTTACMLFCSLCIPFILLSVSLAYFVSVPFSGYIHEIHRSQCIMFTTFFEGKYRGLFNQTLNPTMKFKCDCYFFVFVFPYQTYSYLSGPR